MVKNVFQNIPAGFFNLLASNTDNLNNAGLLIEIYEQYETEVSYRISRKKLRDAVALYIIENDIHVPLEEIDDKSNDIAGGILRKFSKPEYGWLTEEIDDGTYEKYMVMTEAGIALAEFLLRISQPEKVEYVSYIFDIYNTLLKGKDQWEDDPYVGAIKKSYRDAKALSRALKRLSTFIRKKIEQIANKTTLEEITNHLIEYYNGDFIREYARLTTQQNIHIYRRSIQHALDKLMKNERDLIITGCAVEEDITPEEAEELLDEMVDATNRFLNEDYDRIMLDIRKKINTYIRIAIARLRFRQTHGQDTRGNVETVLKLLKSALENTEQETIEEVPSLHAFDKHEYIDRFSLSTPRKTRAVKEPSITACVQPTKEEAEESAQTINKSVENTYSMRKMKKYIKQCMGSAKEIHSDQLPLQTSGDLLADVMSAALSEANGFDITVEDGYTETGNMLLRNFTIRRK